MTSAKSLLDDLTRRGVSIEPRSGRLHVEAPAGVLSDADRAALREMKPALLDLLVPPVPPVFLQAFVDGCKQHGVTQERVNHWWGMVADEQEVSICACCCGPGPAGSALCRICDGSDLQALMTAPPCSCGRPGYERRDGGVWLCESCAASRQG